MPHATSASETKHFLDTSVVIPMLVGSTPYRKYFQNEFGDEPCYISAYVQMEFKRGYFCHIIQFYLLLNLPSISTLGDAFELWSNRFSTRELKAVLRFAGDFINRYSLVQSDPRDKEKALGAIGSYVKRLEMKLRKRFRDTGIDSTRCTRAKVKFDTGGGSLTQGLQSFSDQFNDLETCSRGCRIGHFVFQRYQAEMKTYIERAATLPNRSIKENRGFAKIAEDLEEILSRTGQTCSCRDCQKIGDAIIALDARSDMQLEHTDYSFDHLCPPIGKPHRRHPSESQTVNPRRSQY